MKNRTSLLTTTVFEHKTFKLVPEIDIPTSADNHEILRLIHEYLNNCQKEVKGRTIDNSQLNVIGQFVDWRTLLDNERV